MNKMKLTNLLFGTETNQKPDIVKESDTRIGMAIQDPAAAASCRPAVTSIAVAPVKLSFVVQGLATLLDPSECPSFCGIDSSLYLEKDGRQAIVMASGTDGYHIRTSPEAHFNARTLMAAILMFEVSFKKTETLQRLQTCVKTYAKTGFVTRVEAGALCDAFYYEFKARTFVLLEDNLTSQEIDAMQRQDPPKAIMLSGTAMTRPTLVKTEVKKKTANTPARPEISEIMDRAKSGEYLVPYHWSEEAESYRQGMETLEGFIPNQTYLSLLTKLKFRTTNVIGRIKKEGLDLTKPADRIKAIGNDYINVSLSGKPGTGKTRLAYALGAATGMPVYTISNSHNTDEDNFTGLTKMVDGCPMSVATDTVKCFEGGGILLLEEVNLAQAAVVMGALGQALEFPFLLMKDGYIPIRRHPLCIIISTMNTGTAGSKAVSQPFANRFKQSFVLDDPSKEDFIRILGNTGAEVGICRWVYECYERIVAGIENDNAMADVESILLSLSVRTCIGAIENIQEGMEPRQAITNSIIGKISEQDRDVAKACQKIVDGMRNPIF